MKFISQEFEQQPIPPCPVRKKCAGCQLTNLSYEEQLAMKQSRVIKLLGDFCHVRPIIGMDNPYHYRNKVQAAFGTTRSGKLISGVYQSKDGRIVAVDHCQIENEAADVIICTIRKLLKAFKLTAYNAYTNRGFLRHVLIRYAAATGEILVSLVAATPVFPSKNAFIKQLLRAHPEITTIVFGVSTDEKALIQPKRETILYGSGYITDHLCGLDFRITATSFYQVNPIQTEVLYKTAMDFAKLTGTETVIDAYCGVGTIGLIAAPAAKHVTGVETNGEAVKNAIRNARANGIKNATFVHGDAGKFMTELSNAGEHVDLVFMDPPRAGSDRAFLSSVAKLQPNRIVYISCNPETQKRDLQFLTRHGYRVREIQPVDMFPHTNHVETVVLMTRTNAGKV
ncbi:MAG: 23S rRNA (uracil(1939)-C(5))-methyltransferase RlmD [Oscillospiraceae bacterium]|jgi:23S rRNA (uracil1939-C5)-methyltransferase